MNIIAIDPGPVQSALVIYNAVTQKIVTHSISPNEQVLNSIVAFAFQESEHTLVIEQVAAMGMAVGAEVFETVFWSGRFAQAFGRQFHRIKRYEVKMHLCGNMRAKDGNIRQALIDRLGAPGTKKAPGKTYGMSGDMWQALAVAVTFSDGYGERKVQEIFKAA